MLQSRFEEVSVVASVHKGRQRRAKLAIGMQGVLARERATRTTFSRGGGGVRFAVHKKKKKEDRCHCPCGLVSSTDVDFLIVPSKQWGHPSSNFNGFLYC